MRRGPRARRRVLQLAPLAFDASTFEIWRPLLNGATLVLMPPASGRVARPAASARNCIDVALLHLTAQLCPTLLVPDDYARRLAGVKHLLIGGEAVLVRLRSATL